MSVVYLVFPHQLFSKLPGDEQADHLVWLEDPLFFSQFSFHRQKLMLHRASMQWHFQNLKPSKSKIQKHYATASDLTPTPPKKQKGKNQSETTGAVFVDSKPSDAEVKLLVKRLEPLHANKLIVVDPEDDFLERKLRAVALRLGCTLDVQADPNFLTPISSIESWSSTRKKWFFADFYKSQRLRTKTLIEDTSKPAGGKWSFDTENRKKLPKGIAVPNTFAAPTSSFSTEAREYVRIHFPHALGEDMDLYYPHDPKTARAWCEQFMNERLGLFGDYEDAMSQSQTFLFHSVLTPMLNVGMLAPQDVIAMALERRSEVSIASLEGFIRQVLGWREYMRAVYRKLGRQQRCRNYWPHHRPIPASFYDGTTGIQPVDHVIRRVLRYGYCHHIERLMVLGNFMLLCEFHPDAIYRWFMELFVDAYDWVMVPNVYGMSQHADGGLITTKPYLSGSSYVLKMSDFKKGEWCAIWDGLYWNFMFQHRSFFEANPRMSVMTKMLDKMGTKLDSHLRIAKEYLGSLDG